MKHVKYPGKGVRREMIHGEFVRTSHAEIDGKKAVVLQFRIQENNGSYVKVACPVMTHQEVDQIILCLQAARDCAFTKK